MRGAASRERRQCGGRRRRVRVRTRALAPRLRSVLPDACDTAAPCPPRLPSWRHDRSEAEHTVAGMPTARCAPCSSPRMRARVILLPRSTTSLLMASKGGHKQIVELLLRHRADTEVAGRAYGTTSLVAAAHQGHAEVVALLLREGANPFKTLNDGSNALGRAREAGHAEVVRVLQQAMGEEVYPTSPSPPTSSSLPPVGGSGVQRRPCHTGFAGATSRSSSSHVDALEPPALAAALAPSEASSSGSPLSKNGDDVEVPPELS